MHLSDDPSDFVVQSVVLHCVDLPPHTEPRTLVAWLEERKVPWSSSGARDPRNAPANWSEIEIELGHGGFLTLRRARGALALTGRLRRGFDALPAVLALLDALADAGCGRGVMATPSDIRAAGGRIARDIVENGPEDVILWWTHVPASIVAGWSPARADACVDSGARRTRAGGLVFLSHPDWTASACASARVRQARFLAALRGADVDTQLETLVEWSDRVCIHREGWPVDHAALFERVARWADGGAGRVSRELGQRATPPVLEYRAPDAIGAPRADPARWASDMSNLIEVLPDSLDVPPDFGGARALDSRDVDALLTFDHLNHHRPLRGRFNDQGIIEAGGALLGTAMILHLGGAWQVREDLLDCAVVIGDRAWLPFLRAKRALGNAADALDYSLAAMYTAAERHSRSAGTR